MTGSSLSQKQLGRTVIEGRKVTFCFPAPVGEEARSDVVGYICGADDFHWMVVCPPDGQKVLVHKGSAPLVLLADEPSYDDEPSKDVMEEVVGPFRTFLRTHRYAPSTRKG